MRQPKKGIIQRYQVEHPALGRLIVDGLSKENATVVAAKRWGIPWAKEAAYMRVIKLGIAPRPRCKRCGREFGREGDVGVFCPDCQRADEIYRLERAAVKKADRRAGKR